MQRTLVTLNWKLGYDCDALFPRIAEHNIAASAMSEPSTKLKFIDCTNTVGSAGDGVAVGSPL